MHHLTDDAVEWRRHSTNSSVRATLEMKDAKHAPAISIHLKLPKFRNQVTLAVEHIQAAINNTQYKICCMIAPPPLPIPLKKWGGISSI
jgi:hypothetical protein